MIFPDQSKNKIDTFTTACNFPTAIHAYQFII